MSFRWVTGSGAPYRGGPFRAIRRVPVPVPYSSGWSRPFRARAFGAPWRRPGWRRARAQTAAARMKYQRVSPNEIKSFDCTVTNPFTGGPNGLHTIGSITPSEPSVAFAGLTEINCIPQGTANWERVGSKIVVRSIRVRFVSLLMGTAPVSSTFRWMLVYDRQPGGAFPTIDDILARNIGTAPVFSSSISMDNSRRFVFLRDQTLSLSASGANREHNVDQFVQCRLVTQYGSNGGTIGDLTTGALYFIAFCAETGTPGEYVQLTNIEFRLRYED